MIKFLMPLTLSLLIGVLTGCGGDSDSSSDSSPTPITEYDGAYTVSFTSDTSGGKDDCRGNGTITIKDGEGSGSLKDSDGNTLLIDGKISESGDIHGRFWVKDGGEEQFATYEGHVGGNTGSGTWDSNDSNCEGTWKFVKN